MKRLPSEAFDHYVELGAARSYEAVANHYGVSKVTVVNHATRDRWQERLKEAEQKAREDQNKRAVDTLQDVKDRQLREARILEIRALEALKTLPPEKACKAAMMLQIAWRHELLLLGEPSERTELTIEEVTRREIQTLLEVVKDEPPAAATQPEPEFAEDLPIPRSTYPACAAKPAPDDLDDSWIVYHPDDAGTE